MKKLILLQVTLGLALQGSFLFGGPFDLDQAKASIKKITKDTTNFTEINNHYKNLVEDLGIENYDTIKNYIDFFGALFVQLSSIETIELNLKLFKGIESSNQAFINKLKSSNFIEKAKIKDTNFQILLNFYVTYYVGRYLLALFLNSVLNEGKGWSTEKNYKDFISRMYQAANVIVPEDLKTKLKNAGLDLSNELNETIENFKNLLATFIGIGTTWPPAITNLNRDDLEFYLYIVQIVIILEVLHNDKESAQELIEQIQKLPNMPLENFNSGLNFIEKLFAEQASKELAIMLQDLSSLSVNLSALKNTAGIKA